MSTPKTAPMPVSNITTNSNPIIQDTQNNSPKVNRFRKLLNIKNSTSKNRKSSDPYDVQTWDDIVKQKMAKQGDMRSMLPSNPEI